jgi:hypothetical protein
LDGDAIKQAAEEEDVMAVDVDRCRTTTSFGDDVPRC